MSLTPEALRQLHSLHQRQESLKERLEAGPRQVKAAEVAAQRIAEHVEQAKEASTRVKMTSDERQLQLKSNEARIADLNNKLMTAGSNKEYQALKEQIAADEVANSVLSDEILELFDKVDEQEAQVATAEEQLKKGREDLDAVTRKVSDEKAALETELAEVQAELTQAEKVLPGDFRQEYDRVVRKKAGDALAPLDGESCGSCYVQVTPQMINDILMCRPVFCKSCGSMLYQPKSD